MVKDVTLLNKSLNLKFIELIWGEGGGGWIIGLFSNLDRKLTKNESTVKIETCVPSLV